jgi:hypothetical protein
MAIRSGPNERDVSRVDAQETRIRADLAHSIRR